MEGAAFEDKRGLSIWDVFSRIPNMVSNGDTPDITPRLITGTCLTRCRYRTDFDTQKRIIKDSGRWYRELIRSGLVKPLEPGVS
ncbi:MAG: hypothetical protein LBC62_04735 [Treponema sp.]|nr:hypothetical protein [Treponema sp.]